MRFKLFFIFIVLLIHMPHWSWAAIENLHEMEARSSRQSSSTWGRQYLENAQNYYYWQPETLCYKDISTNHEVWVLVRAPDRGEDIYSQEHGSNAWSFDGSRIGFFARYRGTNNPSVGSYDYRWIVNSDGSGLKATEGYGRRSIPGLADFGWAHTENAYYTFGSGVGEGSVPFELYKNTVNDDNVVSGSLILDTSNIDTISGRELVKEGISSDDSWLVARGGYYGRYGTPNDIETSKLYFIKLKPSPSVEHHWGIARGCGPAGDPYGPHEWSYERKFHDVWSPGIEAKVIGQYQGQQFWEFKRSGSYSDGGPKWEDWDGDSFGENEEIKAISDWPQDNPYGMTYFGHPVFDRWGRYGLIGTYTDSPRPGTRIWDSSTNSLLPNYVLAYAKYDGQHHSWTGFTDYVIGVDPQDGAYLNVHIYSNKYDESYNGPNLIDVCNTHYSNPCTNYNALPRPSQSPDGTKVAFAQYFLNSAQAYPHIAYAVVYYPHPPKVTGASKVGTHVRISWRWDNDSKYTTRGWPNEATDDPPEPREIKYYHVWTSEDNTTWTELTTTGVPFGTNYYNAIQQNSATRYYAVTSEEHSRLESRTLSNIWQVTLNASGNITTSAEQSPYPSDPGGVNPFWTTPPPAPSNLNVEKMATPGHYQLTWTGPGNGKIRYYNIYYSTSDTPPAGQKYRIASVPVGTSAWLDWCADPNLPAYYRITSVDRYGNESGESVPPYDNEPPTVPGNLRATAKSSTQIDLSWVTSTDNVGVAGYRIYRAGNYIGVSSSAYYSDARLIPSTTYSYRIAAYDAAGNESEQSNPASATTQTGQIDDNESPTVPNGLSASAISSTQIDLSWNASTDNIEVVGYKIYRDGSYIGITTPTSYSNTGLSPFTTYTYTVSAYDAADNESSLSNPASATTQSASSQTTTIIEVGDTWKYFEGYSDPASGWNDITFNDQSWLQGSTGIGFGDDDDGTVLSDMQNNYLAVYARKTFEINNPSSVAGMVLSIDYDDGFVAYINGKEIARANMSGVPSYDVPASGWHEVGNAQIFDLSIYLNVLQAGANVLAIETHNATIDSSDLSMIPELVLTYEGPEPPNTVPQAPCGLTIEVGK